MGASGILGHRIIKILRRAAFFSQTLDNQADLWYHGTVTMVTVPCVRPSLQIMVMQEIPSAGEIFAHNA